MRVYLATLVLVAVVTLAMARSASPSTAPDSRNDVLVFAAASLTDAFKALGGAFERANPGTTVRFSFAGSHQLATQILHGAPADVFASADPRQLQAVTAAGEGGRPEEGPWLARGRAAGPAGGEIQGRAAGPAGGEIQGRAAGPAGGETQDRDGRGKDLSVVGQPRLFATNRLVIVVERGNPLGVRGLADLARADLTLVLAAEEVPAGRYARQALHRAGVEVAAASLENDVRAVLFKVRLGEADAGIVYTSDVLAAGSTVDAVPIPPVHNVIARYPLAVLAGGPNPDGGQAFVTFAQSVEGQALLSRYGFSVP